MKPSQPRSTPGSTPQIPPRKRLVRTTILAASALLLAGFLALDSSADKNESPSAAAVDPNSQQAVGLILSLLSGDRDVEKQAFDLLEQQWQPSFVPMLLEILHLSRDPIIHSRVIGRLERATRQKKGSDIDDWYEWLWSQEAVDHPDYANFKAAIYGLIDPRFRDYFSNDRTAKIRLDEVRWGGVVQDGIPPLRQPKMLAAGDADYLADSNVVFGLEVNGDARAYPKRILAWHEMFVDTVGGVPVAGVYCTLCGTMILYETVHDGVAHELGTSGFLYRSNKLMYDRRTQSLWNTIWGTPVIGPLAEQDIALERRSVVTTTWGEWRRRHPDTQVLSLDTGHQRDYGEGVAYRAYFATDELMFTVPDVDRRLRNKAEVLALIFDDHPDQPLAISAKFLKKNPLHHEQVGEVPFVVLTDRSGANRVFATGGRRFASWDQDRIAVDEEGVRWTMDEDQLTAADGATLARLPGHRAFWFGWYSAYPETRLVR
ncbi:MAG: DUF3179 domain-containing protein [Acidobacteriota bacterium]